MNGYICAPAASAAEARELLQQQAFELALCDVNMPGESGLSLVRHILAKHPDTATIMVTGDRKSTRLNSSHGYISYAVFCLKKKKKPRHHAYLHAMISAQQT